MIGSICAVISGFLTVAVSSTLIFYAFKLNYAMTPPPNLLVSSFLFSIVIATLGGYIAASIAIHRKREHAAIVGGLFGMCALASLVIKTLHGGGSIWLEVAMMLMAPSALLGGVIRRNMSVRKSHHRTG